MVPSYVFYTKKEASDWAAGTTFPKVFKLRGGAGASNVKLIRSASDAKKVINKAFGRGFSQFDGFGYFKDRLRKWLNGRDTLTGVCKGFGRLFIPTQFAKMHPREKGYAYFQDFIPDNDFDIRVLVIGDKAFSIKRMCREGDFRASGSGRLVYDKSSLDENCVKTAFDVDKKLDSQCTAFDFVFSDGKPLIVEISYGFAMHGYDLCPGYWTSDMNWHDGTFFPQYWMVENILNTI